MRKSTWKDNTTVAELTLLIGGNGKVQISLESHSYDKLIVQCNIMISQSMYSLNTEYAHVHMFRTQQLLVQLIYPLVSPLLVHL